MTVAAHEWVPAPTAAGGATAGVRPREGRVCAAPRLALRMDRRPRPRLRPLHAVLADLAPRTPAPAPEPAPVDTRALDAALDGARAQVGPIALRVLAAVAEVLDGRRPVDHLAGICPEDALERVTGAVLAARHLGPVPRGARVRGLRLCPLVAPGAHPVLAVEVAAALCVPGPSGPPRADRAGGTRPDRARAVAARFELGDAGWRLTELVVG
ncbi:Rv3235 family protein [Actinomycetospora termitidis]|uniref:Rv3235 family protein n=1 Tax=Actinomycetospora termitidis TaxID=3053470 RepID=A0ABT7M930_9PSEU|nr:Rv3235 family protein [Actinomycetospora sp. Odt1-22]MDL5157176.1 Rv3235 family protein [Actinomycetospora sp. Odt1-22]